MNEEKIGKAWRDFIELVYKSESNEQLEMLTELFFSFEERIDIAKRYIVIKELLKGRLTQREMAKQYDISIAKITRGSNVLKTYNAEQLEKLKGHMME